MIVVIRYYAVVIIDKYNCFKVNVCYEYLFKIISL